MAEARRVLIRWPNGQQSQVPVGSDWLQSARLAGQSIPTGCLGGSCGACEIEVNGRLVRACIASVPPSRSGLLEVTLATDPYW
jgi:ferredoxin